MTPAPDSNPYSSPAEAAQASVDEQLGVGPQGSVAYVCLLTGVAALGGLLFGYDTAVIAGAIDYLEKHFQLTAWQKGWAVSNVLVGCMIGAAFAGMLGDRLGRKKILIVSAILFAASAIWSAIPNSLTEFVFARMLGGLAVGAASILSPLYIAEVSPPHIRGRLVSLNQIAIITGMVVIAVVNWLIASPVDDSWNVAMGWRWMLGSETLPAAIFLGCLLLVPESPRWLTKQGRQAEAMTVLTRVSGERRASAEMAEIQQALAMETGAFRELFRPGVRFALVMAVGLAILQQITGINAVIYYTPTIFKAANVAASQALLQTIAVNVINLFATLIAIWLVDRAGRRPLMLTTSALMGISLALLGASFHFKFAPVWIFVFTLAYIASFGVAMGPVVWVVLAEIFPTRIRGRAMGVSIVALWIACFAVSQTVPKMFETFGQAATFWTYGVMCAVCFVYVLLLVPETKGKSLEEIERSWTRT